MVISSYRCNSLGIPKDINISLTANEAVSQLRVFLADPTDTEFHCTVTRDSVDEPVCSHGYYPSAECTVTNDADRNVVTDDTGRCSMSHASRVNRVAPPCCSPAPGIRNFPFIESFER